MATTGATIGGTAYTFAGVTPAGTVSVGAAGGERTLTNVAAGRLTAGSTDAVNGSELFATNQQVGVNTTAITGIGTGTAGVIQRGTANQLVATAAGGTAAAPGAAQTLTNIAAGGLTAASTDAVNGGQLFATNQQVATDTTAIASINSGAGIKYFHANSTLPDSEAIGTNSVAVGPNAVSSGAGTIAIGLGANSGSTGSSVAIGSGAMANASTANGGAVAIGLGNSAIGDGAVSIGDPNTVNGNGAIALGLNNNANGAGAVAIGNTNTSTGVGAVTLGNQNVAYGQGALALGNSNVADGVGSVALGQNTTVSADNALALGTNAMASAQDSMAVGNNSAATATQATTLGNESTASGMRSTAVGNAATSSGNFSTAVGTNSASTGTAGVAVGINSQATEEGATAIGSGAFANQAFSTALGTGALTQRGAQNDYTAFGLATPQTSIGELAIAAATGVVNPVTGAVTPIGNRQITGVAAGSQPTDAVNVSQLTGAAATLGNAVATDLGGGAAYNAATGAITAPTYTVGGVAYANVGNAIAALNTDVGGGVGAAANPYFKTNSVAAAAIAGAIDSVAIGPAATTSANALRSVAIGSNATTTGVDSVALGSGSTAGAAAAPGTGIAAALNNANGATTSVTYNTTDRTLLGPVSVGSATSYRQIQNVADGQAPTDAVNVRQLQGGVQTAISYTDTYAVGYSATGVTLSSPYAGGPVVIHNVGAGAVTATSMDVVNGSQLYGVQQVALNSVQYDTTSTGVRSNTITFTGGDTASPVQLKNVAAGTTGTDAVNLNQLNNLASYTQNGFNGLNQRINDVASAAQGGIAIALAAAALRYDDRPGKVAISMGAAGYANSAGVAFGLGGTSDDARWRYNAAVSFSPNNTKADVGVSGGASYTFN